MSSRASRRGKGSAGLVMALLLVALGALAPARDAAAQPEVADGPVAWRPPPGAIPRGESGAYVEVTRAGTVETRSYTRQDYVLSAIARNRTVSFFADGLSDDQLDLDFAGPSPRFRLTPGTYRTDASPPARRASLWGGGSSCGRPELGDSVFTVVGIRFDRAGRLLRYTIRFDLACYEGRARGIVHWGRNHPSGPVQPTPIPDDLWRPAPGVTPASGSYAYLESQPGDHVGGGRNLLVDPTTARMHVYESSQLIQFQVSGEEFWDVKLRGPDRTQQLEEGWYTDPDQTHMPHPARSDPHLWLDNRYCSSGSTGWFALDEIVRTAGSLERVRARFEVRCQPDGPPIRGELAWDRSDHRRPPLPGPVPPGLWEPAPGTVPTSGSFVYLDSPPGDYIGGGVEHLFTSADADLSILWEGDHVDIRIDADDIWEGDFGGPYGYDRLEPRWYQGLERWSFRNAAKGGLDVYGAGRGCNQLTGWFAVDEVTQASDGTLTRLRLRFEQSCDGDPPLHGMVVLDG